MRLYYVGHPVGGDVANNLVKAKRWLHWLATTFPEIAFIAPWITACEFGDDSDPAQRARGLAQDCEIVSRCDGIVLLGPRVSQGMQLEREAAEHVIDFTHAAHTGPEAITAEETIWLADQLGLGEEPHAAPHEWPHACCPCARCAAKAQLSSEEIDDIVTRASGGQAEARPPSYGHCPHGVLLLDCTPCMQLVVEAREAQAAKPLVIGDPEDRRQYLHRSATTDGKPPRPGFENASAPGPLKADGQHEAYWVLPEAERAKGFVRPVRQAYRHEKCGAITTMGRALAETYARDPQFYGSTFCVACGAHFPVGPDGEFVWDRTTEKVGT